jgi:hypothetical protein
VSLVHREDLQAERMKQDKQGMVPGVSMNLTGHQVATGLMKSSHTGSQYHYGM